MQFKRLVIALKKPYTPPGPDNPYEATLEVGWDQTDMKVVLSPEVTIAILTAAASDIAEAARVQVGDFVREAISLSRTPQIEGKVEVEA
jgi:hypothetical protein